MSDQRPDAMDATAKPRLLRRLRTGFRWVRIAVWFCIFLVVAAGAYFHLIGLPDFLKRPLLGYLRERGFEAQFSDARLGWGTEVVIDNAAFNCPGQRYVPRFSGQRTVVHFDPAELAHRRVKVDWLRVTQASLELPLSAERGDSLSVNNVSMNVSLLPGDTIRVEVEHANFHGMQIDILGTVTNFMAARPGNQGAPLAPTNAGPATNQTTSPENALREFAAILGQIHFRSTPHLTVRLGADRSDPDSLWTSLSLDAGDTQTSWGEATGVRLTAACVRPLHPGPGPFLKVRLSAGVLTTPQARARNVELTADVSRAGGTNLAAVVTWAADNGQGRWLAAAGGSDVAAAHLSWNGSATWRQTPLTLVAANGTLRGDGVATRWGSAASASVICGVTATDGSPAADASWGVWTNFNRWAVDWQADLMQVMNTNLQSGRIQCAGRWRAPELVLTNLDLTLFDGRFNGDIRLDVNSRKLQADARVDFDPHQIARLLTRPAQLWMAQFTWEKPPEIAARAGLVLPAWTNAAANWWDEVLPSLEIEGNFAVGPASYRNVQVDSAQSHFTYSNQVWNLPRLRATRAEGELWLDYAGNEATGEYLFVGDSGVDPKIARPLLPAQQQGLLDEVNFSGPPQIHAEVRGNWRVRGSTGFTARAAATNFTVRGEKIDRLAVGIEYTNLQARFLEVRLAQGEGTLTADEVAADFTGKRVSLTNVVSTLDPAGVERGLGRLTPGWLRTIIFDTPPTLQVSGAFVPGEEQATDLHFSVSGRNIHYQGLTAGQVSGQVNWVGETVGITNLSAHLYAGSLTGWGLFNYAPKPGTEFRGRIALAKIQLPQLVNAFDKKPTKLEGSVDGVLSVLDGNSADIKSWRAGGHLLIAQARLWDIKLFGVFSPILNLIIPGSGESRAYQASADFVVTNAVLNTDNLEIRSTGFRLVYHGTVNSNKKLDGRVEALLLRDTPLVGQLMRWAFAPLSKLFEYKIGGTLSAPTYKAVNVPKILMDMLHPFRTLKDFLPPEEPAAPPAAPGAAPANGK